MRELRVIVRTLSGKNFIYMTDCEKCNLIDLVLDLFFKDYRFEFYKS